MSKIEDEYYCKVALQMSLQSEDKTEYKKIGAVIIKDGKIVGRGYRKTVVFHNLPYRDITFHAEHLALMEAKEKAKGATMYITMEPCGKRISGDFNALELPKPCCELISDYGISRVVYMDRDDNASSKEYFLSKNIKIEQL